MAVTFKLTIKTPESTVFMGDVLSLKVKVEEDGAIQTLARHANLTTSIDSSLLVIESENQIEEYFVRKGIYTFRNEDNSATLLALYCSPKKEINKKSHEEYLQFVQDQLANGSDLSEFQIAYLEGEKVAVEREINSV
jgi:F0F1-type ATP synthase epsilon subunit